MANATVDPAISLARGNADFAEVETLFREYQAWLDQPVCFENFEQELANLPGHYNPPAGELWLARLGQVPVGVIGMAPWHRDACDNVCEMKRLYVRDSARGLGLGRELVNLSLAWARDSGYSQIVLETFESLEAACAIYTRLGFVRKSDDAKSLTKKIFMSLSLAA